MIVKKTNYNQSRRICLLTLLLFFLVLAFSCKKRKFENKVIGEWIQYRLYKHSVSDYYIIHKYIFKEDHVYERFRATNPDSVGCQFIDTLDFKKEREDLYEIKRHKGALHLNMKTSDVGGAFAPAKHSWSRRKIKQLTDNEIIFIGSDDSERKWIKCE